jgi:hypothetical protein
MAKNIVSTQTQNIGYADVISDVPTDITADGSGTSGHPNAPAYRINLETKVPGIALNNLAWTQSGFVPNTFWKLADGSGNINGGDPYNGLHVVPFGTTGADLPDESNDAGRWIYKLLFDRQGASTSGLEFSINVNIYHDSQEDPTLADNIQYQLVHKFFNSTATKFVLSEQDSYDTTNSWGLAEYVLNLIKGNGTFEDVNSGANRSVSDFINVTLANGTSNTNTSKDSTDDSTGGGTPTNPHYFHIATNDTNRFRKISASITVSGEVFMKKFDQKPAYANNAMDIITKDVDFGFPGVRKKIHKVIVTYKAPYPQKLEYDPIEDTPEAYSNVSPSYALNGQMKLRNVNNYDWKPFNVYNLPSNATIDPNSDTGAIVPGSVNPVWLRQELLPADGMAAWNNIYSIALRFTNIGPVKGFEINDISIIYRVKNLK